MHASVIMQMSLRKDYLKHAAKKEAGGDEKLVSFLHDLICVSAKSTYSRQRLYIEDKTNVASSIFFLQNYGIKNKLRYAQF